MARELSLMDHLRELRRRVLICVIAVIAGSAVSFAFYKQIIEFLSRPAYDLQSGQGIELVFIEVTELLTTAVKVSFVAGFVLALPVVLYQVVMFVAPGLTGRERRYLFLFLPAALLAFAAGVAFAYYVLTPPALRFLLGFSDVAQPLIRISNFVNLMVRLLSWDEWNVWYKARELSDRQGCWTEAPHLIEEVYNLEDALVVAQWLNVFLRRADVLKIACIAQIVNVIAPILTTTDSLLKQTIYYPLLMFSQMASGNSLNLLVESPRYETKQFGDMPCWMSLQPTMNPPGGTRYLW